MRASSKTGPAATASDASAVPDAAPVRFISLSRQATYGTGPSVRRFRSLLAERSPTQAPRRRRPSSQ